MHLAARRPRHVGSTVDTVGMVGAEGTVTSPLNLQNSCQVTDKRQKSVATWHTKAKPSQSEAGG